GYNRQSIDKQGRQQDRFPLSPAADAPVEEVLDSRGQPIRIEFPLGDRTVKAGAYRLEVGRIPLYLLNTDLPENSSRDRKLVDVLYSGDRDMRIRQEILLGIGGWRLLRALKIKPAVYHLNEGHAAFLTLERLVERINQGKSFKQAMRSVANTSVFTTHTPVPAGNEEFDPALVDQYLSDYAELLGLSHTEFHDLARIKAGNSREPFGMTPLALRTSRYCNGVAKLHGEVARDMWKALYPGKPGKRVPIGHVTNGIHLKTWAHPEWSILLDEILGDDWESRQDSPATWKKIQQLPDDILWDFHNSLKAELIELCGDSFDPDALTIGFARRFATYKRAQLIFTQPARLAKIVNNPKRPVQIIFAGKAHPADTQGKAIIEQVVRYSREAQFRGKIYFVEDYEMGIGRQLTAGVDVWLNNPQRPREASGTSGMKPALHGGLNLSILDGWWPEAYNGKNGWAIGKGENYDGSAAADRRDAALLYEMLEKQVVPLYYDRDADGLPRGWIARMKNAIATIPPQFNMHRQVKEYLAKYYLPAMKNA
ncbi:MAG: alpha-glucan family phosphorylase, partial [Phycisphaerae bacterium]|nr:alpha-glucan family phosphorylase [Phycisphaerae bacterium]